MTLEKLQRKLYDKDFLICLLQANQGGFHPPKDIKDIQWDVLPYYLPSDHPRITFHLRTKEGEYLLKLNTETYKIHREAAVCNLLNSLSKSVLIVPQVCAVEVNIPLYKSQSCGWMITEWVNGITVDEFEDTILVDLLPQGLHNLHKQTINDNAVEEIYGLKMPDHKVALEILRKRRRDYFDELIKVCGRNLTRRICELGEMVCSHPFTDHLAFIHGDLHVNNIKYLRKAQNRHRLFLFDWEDVSIDHPLYDLASFILSDNFSNRSLRCLNAYLLLDNRNPAKLGPLRSGDTWMLVAICYVRNLSWKYRASLYDDRHIFDNEAEQMIKMITTQCLRNS